MTHLYEHQLERDGQTIDVLVEWSFDAGSPQTWDHPGSGPSISELRTTLNEQPIELSDQEVERLEQLLMNQAYDMLANDGYDEEDFE